MASIQKQIKDLQQDINDIIAGYYTQPTALGPNTLSKNSVKARTIRSGNIDVSNLEAVQTKTGSLTVDGDLTVGTGGSLRSGKTSYSDVSNAGFWMGIDSTVTKIRVGNIGHTAGWTWDGTTLAITGSVTATSGTIGGWTIGSTDLTADGGATGIASSGSYRIWTGDATPANAEFSVTSAGALKSTSGTIGGWTINGISGLYTGSGASQRGIDTGSTTFYAGSATPSSAPFRVSSSGVLNATGATITGALTASSLSITGTASFSGGSMTLPNGGSITSTTVDLNQGTIGGMDIDGNLTLTGSGKIQISGGSYWDVNGILLKSTGSFGDTIRWQVSGVDKGSLYGTSTSFVMSYPSGWYQSLGSTSYLVDGGTSGILLSTASNSSEIFVAHGLKVTLGDASGTYSFHVRDSSGNVMMGTSSNGAWIHQVTADTTALGSYYSRIPIYINGNLRYLGVYN